jgi:hypothetical protein
MWARVEGELREALAGVDVSEEVRARVLEFLDVNELGLAFQWLVTALADTNAEVSDAISAQLARAAHQMGLQDDPDWRRLTA